MASLSDFERMLPALSRGEKAQILKWVVRELDDDFPGIDSRPDVCGGEPCIVRTRIPVWFSNKSAAWAPASRPCWWPTRLCVPRIW
jgi:hypothetical protein